MFNDVNGCLLNSMVFQKAREAGPADTSDIEVVDGQIDAVEELPIWTETEAVRSLDSSKAAE